ncbi:MAG: hypothetical protein ACM3ZE_19675, partial [Myxococcales bacterium]
DDDEEWRDTKGPSSERGDSSDKKSDAEAEKKAHNDGEDGSSSEGSAEKSADAPDEKSKVKDDKSPARASSDLNVSLAVLGSYGVPSPQGPGIGLRGGYHLIMALPLYFGGVGEYFFGSKSSVTNFGETSTRTRRFMYFAAEGGVSVDALTDVTIRPYVGLGLGLNKDETCSNSSGCSGGTELNLTITPGVVGLYKIDSFFLGPDLRYIIVPGGGLASGIAISATAGLSL